MTKTSGSLTDIAKTLAAVENEFPFETQLTLAPLIRFWDDMAREDSVRSEFARSLQRRLREAPELQAAIEDLSVLERHRSLLDALMSAVFPPAFMDQSHSAAMIPFRLQSIYGTRAFERNLMGPDGAIQGQLNLDARSLKSFRLLNAYALTLYRVYGIESHLDYPLIFTTKDAETGLDRHFKIYFDGRFVDVEPLRPFPPLPDELRQRLDANAIDADGLAALIPPGSVRFSGFSVFKAVDVTDQEVLSSIKRDLIDKESIVSNARFEALQAKLRTLFYRPELRLSLAAIEGNRVLVLNSGHLLASGCIFADSTHHKVTDFAGSVYEQAIAHGEPIFVEDVAAAPVRTPTEDAILKKGMRSVVIAPLHYQQQPIGTLSLTSPNPGDISSLLAPRLHEVLPLFSMAVKRSVDELHSRIQAFIKEKATAIHPVVEWRFRQAVLEILEHQSARGPSGGELPPIVFRDVYPFYAVFDIRGSSTHRSSAIQADLLTQLGLARGVLRAAHGARALPILDHLTDRIDMYSSAIEVNLRSGDEMGVMTFLKGDVEPLFDHLQTFGDPVQERIDAYRSAVDPGLGLVYARRKEFDQSVTLINEAISSYIDLEEQAAQSMFPHYFERQKTDGVDYTIYVGRSLREDGVFDPLYLKNLRVWQLMVACGIALRAERLKDRLPMALDVTSLILIQHVPLSIRFRVDEKRFDVDGAYNVRYEIIKKRIDKAIIRGTTERLTQPGKIALVYSHSSEAQEWREYIEYLQRLGYLTQDLEELELDELEGAQGLRALRVTVDTASRELSAPSTLAGLLPRGEGTPAA
jgi:hypothetical protein